MFEFGFRWNESDMAVFCETTTFLMLACSLSNGSKSVVCRKISIGNKSVLFTVN